ncbi:MAG: DUF819 family protein, partial [Bacteroidota bacterium]|nr:DUF819 family protein [Bacteroidota bacterium]
MSITNNVYVAAILLLLIVFAEWLAPKKHFKYLGSALIIILAAAVLANLHVIPSSYNAPPLYDGIFTYVAPLAIFFLLLTVKLKDLRKAGLPMLSMFLLGAACSVAGVVIGYYIIAPQHHGVESAFAVAGMFTGTYTGGSANLNAVALQYGVIKNGTLFAAINAADNIITTTWIIITLVLPVVLQRWFPRKIKTSAAGSKEENMLQPLDTKEAVSVMGISLLLAMGTASLFISQLISTYIPAVPSILILTTFALGLAQVPAVHKIKGTNILGYFMVLLFLAVVGAYCDVAALIKNGEVAMILLAWVTAIVFIHGILLFVIGGL